MENIDFDIQELLNEMTEALQEAHEVQERYSAKLDELEKENLFLSETITQNKLGLITTERRELLMKVANAESDANKATEEARAIHNEYDEKLNKIALLIKGVQEKQADMDAHINAEAENKISGLKQTLNNNYKKEKSKLQKEYAKLEADIRQKLKNRTIIAGIGLGVGIISVLVMILL